jgi:4'-phosphopantetheinyl transferase
VRLLKSSTDRIDLWLASCEDSDSFIEQYRHLLSDDERRAEYRYTLAQDRRRYVLTRAVIRTVLSRYACTSPADWCFGTNPYGRPEITNNGAARRTLSFSISHTSELVLVGITQRNSLGIDMEAVRGENAPLAIAQGFFTNDEFAGIRALPFNRQAERFFEYWTLKESCIKAMGMGLSVPLNSFGFDLSSCTRILPLAGLLNSSVRWHFWLFRPALGHVAAVCAQRRPGIRQSLSLRRVLPFVYEQSVDCSLIRESDATA